MKITDNVFLVPGIIANPFIILDVDGLTLIDAGLPGSQKKILAYVAGLGKSARDIKRILLTHSDIDHVGRLAALHKATGARTYASQIEAEAIALGQASRQIKRTGFSLRRTIFGLLAPFMKPKPFKVDEILTDGHVLAGIGGGLQVLDTSGHTPGHISLYAPASGVLPDEVRRLHGQRRAGPARLPPRPHVGLEQGTGRCEKAGCAPSANCVPRAWPGRHGSLWQIPDVD